MLAGLDRVSKLVPGAGFLDFSTGVSKSWQGGLNAFVRGEVGIKPRENVDLFGFGEADLNGARAGLGARLAF